MKFSDRIRAALVAALILVDGCVRLPPAQDQVAGVVGDDCGYLSDGKMPQSVRKALNKDYFKVKVCGSGDSRSYWLVDQPVKGKHNVCRYAEHDIEGKYKTISEYISVSEFACPEVGSKEYIYVMNASGVPSVSDAEFVEILAAVGSVFNGDESHNGRVSLGGKYRNIPEIDEIKKSCRLSIPYRIIDIEKYPSEASYRVSVQSACPEAGKYIFIFGRDNSALNLLHSRYMGEE